MDYVSLSNVLDLCTSVCPTIKKGMDVDKLLSAIGVSKACLCVNIKDHIINNIKAYIAPHNDKYINYSELLKLRSYLVYKTVIDKAPYDSYIVIFILLSNVLGSKVTKIIPFDDSNWRQVILNIKNYISYFDPNIQWRCYVKKEIDLANHALNLTAYGARVKIENMTIKIDGTDRVIRFITENIKHISGAKFIEKILAQLYYFKKFDRYLIFSGSGTYVPNNVKINVPYNYLLNLGFRYLKKDGEKDQCVDNKFSSVIKAAESLCFVLYPVQSYTVWEDIFHKNREYAQFFKDLIFKESIFNLPQVSADHVEKVCEFIINKLNKKITCPIIGYSLDDYLSVLKYFLGKAKNDKCVFFQRNHLNAVVKDKVLDNILSDISQGCEKANAGYLYPSDYERVNYWQKPIIKCKGGQYAILPRTIGMVGFYEALMTKLRIKDKNIDNKIGVFVEEYVKQNLQEHGITPLFGNYAVPGEDGECDIVIESKRGIVLIESKKKPLTRSSKSGRDYQILIDLSNSLIDSQLQCMRTEKILKSKGYIDLYCNGKTNRIIYKNQPICRVTLTFGNYGPIQDRMMVMQILHEFCNITFTKNTNKFSKVKNGKEIAQKMDMVEKKQKKLIDYLKYFDNNKIFFSSYFFNLEQLMLVIDMSKDNEDFYNKLTALRCVSFGTQDFYSEYYCWCRMKKINKI